MSSKESCPICGECTSHVYDGKDCHAGCTEEMRCNVTRIRNKVGDEKLKADLEEQTLRAIKAEGQVKLLEWRIQHAQYELRSATGYLDGSRDEGMDPWG